MSLLDLMAWDAENQVDLIDQPLLMVAGDISDTRYMTDAVFELYPEAVAAVVASQSIGIQSGRFHHAAVVRSAFRGFTMRPTERTMPPANARYINMMDIRANVSVVCSD